MSNEKEQVTQDAKPDVKKGFFKKFPGQFWLVVLFEFFERGSYYGMMSFLSVYFVDVLKIPKENVGVIKGVIQPLLYFLPIISGAIADRFGYRKVLMVAFALLGSGYFLTSQMTTYTAVFAALVVMGFGAGTFKPIISGTIARITDKSNSTQAFGIFYWSINMGAFLFPLILVPFLKSINPAYVIIASAICTAAMIIPTALFFKEPVKKKEVEENVQKREKTTLIQTLANAFEIIYSPVVLLLNLMKKCRVTRVVVPIILIALMAFSIFQYLQTPSASEKFPAFGIDKENGILLFTVDRNMSQKKPVFALDPEKEKKPQSWNLTIYKPAYLDEKEMEKLVNEAKEKAGLTLTPTEINGYLAQSSKKIELIFETDKLLTKEFVTLKTSDSQFKVILKSVKDYPQYKDKLLTELHKTPALVGIGEKACNRLYEALTARPFFLFFVISVIMIGLFITAVSLKRAQQFPVGTKPTGLNVPMVIVPAIILVTWFLPGLTILGKIICSVIYFSILSLFVIDKSDSRKFIDHAKFLLMIVLYSGFWVLYFQMFDSVLWYVQAFVDAASLNNAVNGFLGIFGIKIDWFFDVEHVTVINAATIIILQLLISSIVKNKKAMPTMITGISIATLGMAVLAISTQIWVFMAGIIIFSIGEMTAHPKFISYVGLTSPTDRKAMYMGYIFLYGVFGSSVGGILGAKLYVHFVDNLNQPRTLWLIFSMIGVVTITCLLLYNKFFAPKKD